MKPRYVIGTRSKRPDNLKLKPCLRKYLPSFFLSNGLRAYGHGDKPLEWLRQAHRKKKPSPLPSCYHGRLPMHAFYQPIKIKDYAFSFKLIFKMIL